MLSIPEFRVLLILSGDPNATVAGIADGLGVNELVARAVLDSLRREGFMEGEQTGARPLRAPLSHGGMRGTSVQPSFRSQA